MSMKLLFSPLLKKYDTKRVFESVNSFPDQAQQAFVETRRLRLPKFIKVKRVVLAGMGGSALGAHVVLSACAESLKAPIIIINDYKLPAWVDSETLVILASYSGTTEETLAAYKFAKKAKAKLLVICAGGSLANIAKTHKIPSYIFRPVHNPSDQPRIGLGYAVFGLIGLLQKTGLLELGSKEIQETLAFTKKIGRQMNLGVASSPAAKMSQKLLQRAVLVAGAEHLSGAAHVIANQLNETAKTFATWFAVPELNHHLMEGLTHPKQNIRNTTFLILNSSLYAPRIQKRMRLTKEIIQRNGAKVVEYKARAKTRLSQAIELLIFGGNLTLGLGLQYHINPADIKWVNYFKHKLGH
ncbi:SIS domain-containing protein [Candidatus Parcubacteria bacterium]|nr:MAG: SIS domain-containing protein [Candidatus Parcubacteria bacterium]